MIDLENPPALMRKRLRWIIDQARTIPGWDPARCQMWSYPGGIDVRDPAGRRMLMSVIARSKPDLILGGPVYKMTIDRGERAEQQHSGVTSFWDAVRAEHGCALWLEAHAPMEQAGQRAMRPVGSGIWLRWPEYGISLTESKDQNDKTGTLRVGTFRGHRQHRTWPVKLIRAKPWPFEAVYAGLPVLARAA
jgi:replicative DNA helicase